MQKKTRVHFAPSYLQNPSHKLSVLLIGCGGTGSQVITCLARMNTTLIGMGHPGLHVDVYDGDNVSPANMGRQLFSPVDLNRSKAEVHVERINRFFGLNWTATSEMFTEKTRMSHNFMLSCTDSIAVRAMISSKFTTKGAWIKREGSMFTRPFYWMDFGNGLDYGQVIMGSRVIAQPESEEFSVASHLPALFQVFPKMRHQKEDESGPSCSIVEAIRKQDLFINSILAQLGCNIIWKLIKEGSLDHHGAFLNLKTLSVKPLKL